MLVGWVLVLVGGCAEEQPRLQGGDPDDAFSVVLEQMCRLLERCELYTEGHIPFTMEACRRYAGRSEVYREDLDEQTVTALQRCLDEIAAIDGDACDKLGEDLVEGMPECTAVDDYLDIFKGDYDDVCQRAIKKWNECNSADDSAQVAFVGPCSDYVVMVSASGSKTVDFKSWSEAYLACDPRPQDCLCEGLPSWEDYTSPE